MRRGFRVLDEDEDEDEELFFAIGEIMALLCSLLSHRDLAPAIPLQDLLAYRATCARLSLQSLSLKMVLERPSFRKHAKTGPQSRSKTSRLSALANLQSFSGSSGRWPGVSDNHA